MKKQSSHWSRQCKAQMAMLDKTLTDLSKETKLSKTYISSIINGRINAPGETVQLICNALDVEMPAGQ